MRYTREEKYNNIIKDFGKAKSLALTAIKKYLAGRHATGGRDGFWHGNQGNRRVLKLQQYLRIVQVEERLILLALFLAVFKGSSNRLSELITDEWVKGTNGDYTSQVFSDSALSDIGSSEAEIITYAEFGNNDFAIFKKAIKAMLEAAAEQREFKKDSVKMHNLIKALKRTLDDRTDRINLQILPPTPNMANLYASAAVVGAFSGTLLPIEVCIIISAHLTRAESARSLVCVNKAASNKVKAKEILDREFKNHSLLYRSDFISSRKPDFSALSQNEKPNIIKMKKEPISQPRPKLEEKAELKEIKKETSLS